MTHIRSIVRHVFLVVVFSPRLGGQGLNRLHQVLQRDAARLHDVDVFKEGQSILSRAPPCDDRRSCRPVEQPCGALWRHMNMSQRRQRQVLALFEPTAT